MNLFDLSGKKAIVTGGTRGLGHGIAEGLMEAGAKVVIIGSSGAILESAEALREKGFDCQGLQADLSSHEVREAVYHEAVSLLGGLDILVNAAGIQRRHSAAEFPLEEWRDVLEVNLTASFELCQLAARTFLSKEVPSGKIINIASMLSFFGGFNAAAYAASKGGVAQFSKDMCNELAGKGINVNCIAPGYMATKMTTPLQSSQEITGRIPAGRWGTPEDLKGAAIFLSSAASDYVNGAVIPVDGGYLAR